MDESNKSDNYSKKAEILSKSDNSNISLSKNSKTEASLIDTTKQNNTLITNEESKRNLEILLQNNQQNSLKGSHFLKSSLGITVENINLEIVDEEKRTILHRACLQIKLEIIKDIEERLINKYVNQLDKYGNSPLILACKLPIKNESEERYQIVEILLNSGADIQHIEPINGWTALHWCCFNGELSIVKLLISKGANFFIPCKYGFFPIDYAGIKLFNELVFYLVNVGINYLLQIGEYELLDVEKIEICNIENINNVDKNNDSILIDSRNKLDNNKENYENENIKDSKIENNFIFDINTNLSKISQTVYLRLFTEHCLYWSCFFDYSENIINDLLDKFHTHPDFNIYCLENKTSFHASCFQGNIIPFELIYKNYEKTKILYNNRKSTKTKFILLQIEGDDIKKINYPKQFSEYKNQFSCSKHFKSLNKKFQKYLLNKFFQLIYPKTILSHLTIDKILDNKGNNPIALAAQNSNYKFFPKLEKIIPNLENLLRIDNNLKAPGFYYIKDRELFNELLTKIEKQNYPMPPVVLELNKNKKTKTSINLIMKIGISEKLGIELMQHIDKNKLYILVNITHKYFCEQAEKEKLEIKLLNKYLKLPFENNEKYISSVEPFLSRHYQYIITKTLQDIFDIKMLEDQKIVNSIFTTHNPSTTMKIYHNMIKKSFIFGNPIIFINDYFFEGKNLNYPQILLLYRYFGQAIAMYYSFYGFFILMYLPLAIVSIVYICVYKKKIFISEEIYPTFFIITAFWNLLGIAKWKRKCTEIQHKWGMKISEDKRVLRSDFKGDEYYPDNDSPLIKHMIKNTSNIAFFYSLPFYLILFFLDFVIFYFTTRWEDHAYEKNYFWFKYLPSIIRVILLIILSYFYDMVSLYSTKLENIKYEDVYETFMILKIFLFRLLSEFASVVYHIFATKDINRIKNLLYTTLIIKYLYEIIFRFIKPIISQWLSGRIYFQKVAKKTKEYNNNYNNKSNENEKGDKDLKNLSSNDNNFNNDINNNINNDINNNKISKKNCEKYNRVSLITGKKIIENEFNPKKIFNVNSDFIEIQRMLKTKRELFYEYADIFVNHSLISVFAIFIPFSPLICFIFSIISQNARLYVDLFYLKRPLPLKCKSIKLWNKLLDFLITFMTFINCFFIYMFGCTNIINNQLAKDSEYLKLSGEKGLFYIIVCEHIFIILQYLLKYSLPEMPKWVKKDRISNLNFYQTMKSDQEINTNLEISITIERLRNKIYNTKNEINDQKIQIRKFQEELSVLNQKIIQKDGKIREYSEALDIINSKKNKIDLNTENMNFPRLRKLIVGKNGMFTDIIQYDSSKNYLSDVDNKNIFFSEAIIKNKIDVKYDTILQKIIANITTTISSENLNDSQLELFKENNINAKKIYFYYILKKTFNYIEKIILSKKLEFFLKNNPTPLSVCSTCNINKATFKCEDCDELFCNNCKETHLSNELWEEHMVSFYELPILYKNEDLINEPIMVSFLKGESFTFPTSMVQNIGYQDLMTIFDILYVEYLTNNGINSENFINIKEYISIKNNYYTKLENIPSKAIEDELEYALSNISYNWTEIYFINRICFKNFKYYGAKTTIDKIYLPLKNLQTSTFENKLKILLNLLDLYDNKIILKSEIKKFFEFSLLQCFSENFSYDIIINALFPKNNEYMEFGELYTNILSDQKLKQIFKYLLQCND